MKSLSIYVVSTGALFLASTIALAVTQTPLGSPLFFALAALVGAAYVVILVRVWNVPTASRRLLLAALALAVAFRVPLAAPRVNADNDMVRYLWDGRVQRLGYNPYTVVPADPAMTATHTHETSQMPSGRAHTPYPPGAQLFFRLVVTIHDSSRAMKLALVGCDLLTILVLWRWLVVTGRNEWLALAYAWNPLVVLEVAHSGHIDALGALWIVASAFWLTRRRTLLASLAFVLAVATKLLPIVLLPLFWKRVRPRDALVAAVVFALLYAPFREGSGVPLGAVPNVVQHIRFNGPLFRAIAGLSSPSAAAAVAVVLGLLVAAWARWKWPVSEPAAWAWPMAIALAWAPVIYPWYLLYFTPFLFTAAAAPLIAWTFSALPVYTVWELSRHGGRWRVPAGVMIAEYAIVVAAIAASLAWRGRRGREDARPETTGSHER
ncbi:MAG: hypothetical protein A3H96_04215 [Acidobacteria bacterium RIFCSPLOWO2_02_FULL_67_36]|nr:MAG: hypothetical protein A3H96_04215 [Acidobacteria bacterium RIFCSPLOWO2_02_FULL_67_36]OFW19714.1 MAG: hypothetical protein A3G21_13100 [Acidobacteria bacterium RIFCSPLOWO2_12_FULL_66_21]